MTEKKNPLPKVETINSAMIVNAARNSQTVPFYGCCGAFILYASNIYGASYLDRTGAGATSEKYKKEQIESLKENLTALLDTKRGMYGMATMILTSQEKKDYEEVVAEFGFECVAGPYKNPNTLNDLYMFIMNMNGYKPAPPAKKSAIRIGR